MKVQLVKAKSQKRWYAHNEEPVIGKVFKVSFSEQMSKKLKRNVFEIVVGQYKGKCLDVRDTRIVVKVKSKN